MSENTSVAGTEQEDQEAVAESTQPNLHAEIEELRSTNRDLLAKFDQLISAMAPKKQEETLESIQDLAKTDLVGAIKKIVSHEVKNSVGTVGKELTKEQQKVFFDQKAEKDFPQIGNDPEFQKLVKGNIQEMVASGEMSKDSPRLVYWAAERAALKYKGKAKTTTTTASGMSGEAPRSGGTHKAAQSSDKNFDMMVKMFGIKNVDKMKERLGQGGKK